MKPTHTHRLTVNAIDYSVKQHIARPFIRNCRDSLASNAAP